MLRYIHQRRRFYPRGGEDQQGQHEALVEVLLHAKEELEDDDPLDLSVATSLMDLAVVISSKGEVPPHTFIKVTNTDM